MRLGRRQLLRLPALALLLAAAGFQAGTHAARAGSSIDWQTIDGPNGFQLQAPNGWNVQAAINSGSTLQEAIASPNGQEHVNVYVTALKISLADLPLFVSTYVGNAALGAPITDQPQTATVSGAAAAATLAATYTDGSGTRVSDTVLAAATGAQIYVLDIITPASYALENAGQIQTIVQSFAITGS